GHGPRQAAGTRRRPRGGEAIVNFSMKKLFYIALVCCIAAAEPSTRPAVTTRPALAQAGALAADEVRVLRDLRYGDGPGRSNLLDLYIPATEAGAATKRPLVIWVHGGAWMGGDKGRCPIADAVRDGFVVASINYRLSAQ